MFGPFSSSDKKPASFTSEWTAEERGSMILVFLYSERIRAGSRLILDAPSNHAIMASGG